MPRKISKSDREVQLSALALADGYEFVGWVGEYVGWNSKAVIKCSTHGDWSVGVSKFINDGSRCRECSFRRSMSKVDREKQIIEMAMTDGYEFVGWVGEYINVNSKITVRCSSHGNFELRVSHFTVANVRCPKCAIIRNSNRQLTPQITREQQLTELAAADGYEFVGWADDYTNQYTRVIIECPQHGRWNPMCVDFINGKRCSGCASYGYSQGKPGVLYALLSECDLMIKIGITNNVKQRFSQLRKSTPFKFTVLRELSNTDGSIPRTLEKMFHDQFPSAGLTGFDGATEWRQMSPDVTTWLDLLQ